MTEMQRWEIIEWLRPLTRFGGQFEIKEIQNNRLHLYLYTDKNKYSISIRFPTLDDNTSYIGCIMDSRKPRAGETWTRGRDLHDGKLTFETWVKIMADILAMEAVKLQCDKSKIFNIDYKDKTPGRMSTPYNKSPEGATGSTPVPTITTSESSNPKTQSWNGLEWHEPTRKWRKTSDLPAKE